jgi:hypothetical protein
MFNQTKAYEKRRGQAATALIEAARNITFDEAEQKPIEAIQVALGTYEARIQRARDFRERGDPGFVSAYREAADVMDKQLLPEADKLDEVNWNELEKVYEGLSGRSVMTVSLLLTAGALFIWALISIQKFLNRRMRRILNPFLVLTTLMTLGFMLYTLGTLTSARRHLKIAKEDAFTSIRALWRARATAYSAKADEIRYLLDPVRSAEYESAFLRNTGLLIQLPSGMRPADVEFAARHSKLDGLKGYLADELNNITFDSERDAAVGGLTAFLEYERIDVEIRRLEKSGRHDDAIGLYLGTDAGESTWAFEQFDQAIGKTLEIKQQAFNTAAEEAFAALSHFELKACIIGALIAVLAFFGLIKRIQEYQ